MWTEYDFYANKYKWDWLGHEASIPVRNRNLSDAAKVLQSANIKFWLQGKTLQGIITNGELLADHDDDLGLWASDWKKVKLFVNAELVRIGFECIRDTNDIVSFVRDERYIDICLFRRRIARAGYAGKYFPIHHFLELSQIEYNGYVYPAPSGANILLKYIYSPSIYRLAINKTKFVVCTIFRLKQSAKNIAYRLMAHLPHNVRIITSIFFMPFGVKYVQLNEESFRNVLIEPSDSFNWRWRKPHLDLVTNSGSLVYVGEILDLFSKPDVLDNTLKCVIETDTTRSFNDPANFDPRFWQSGNNFFIYCIKFQFRYGVLPYQKVNEYIKTTPSVKVFSYDYYQSLPEMTDSEIVSFLKSHPVEFTRGAVTGGKHRVFAMIGRLAAGKCFLPMWAICIR